MSTPVRIGVVGGGLMGKELLALTRRWDALIDHPVRPEVVALADPAAAVQQWWREAGVVTITDDYRRLLDDPGIDVVYLAVPHDLHERLYLDAVAAGKDFLGEKPFGIDLAAAERIVSAVDASSAFVRVSSELPFFPARNGRSSWCGTGSWARCWRSGRACCTPRTSTGPSPSTGSAVPPPAARLGVMGDLGMHAAHVPLRLGWEPHTVFALLDDVVRTRPGPNGEPVPCDTFDNATLALTVETPGRRFPMLWETKRIAPGQRNTWFFEALGMEGGVRFSTRSPQVLQRFGILDGEQAWSEVQPGHQQCLADRDRSHLRVRLPDALLQMWAAFLAERAGLLAAGSARRPRTRPSPRTACSPRPFGRTRPAERAGCRLTSRASASGKGVDVARRGTRGHRAPTTHRTALLPRWPAPGRLAPAGPRRGPQPGTRRRCRPRRWCRRW
jgi:predicted dehydrogenase